MRRAPGGPGIGHEQRGETRLRLGSVDERETFLGFQRNRLRDLHVAFTDHGQREMRQRRQIAGRTHTALRRHARMYAAIEHVDQQLGDHRSHAAGPAQQHVRPEQHHGAHRVRRQRVANARRVTADEIELQPARLLGRDTHVRELSESRVDAVHRLAALDRRFHRAARLLHGSERLWRNRHRRIASGDRDHVGDGERMAIKRHRLGHGDQS